MEASLSLSPSPKFKKKAVLIGIDYHASKKDGMPQIELRGCQRDALNMQKLLIKHYGYKLEDTVLLIDKEGYLQPTRDNIIHEIKELVKGAQTGDHFFFHFSGHAKQEETDDISEEDGKDEFIITVDEAIVDDELRELLVNHLPIGSTLHAVLDSCHSGTLLDLPHINCNSVYVPWVSKGKRASATMQISVVRKQAMWQYSMSSHQQGINQINSDMNARPMSVMTNVNDFICYDTPALPIPRCQSPTDMFCSGFCSESNPPLSIKTTADVISLSAAKDGQRSWECENGESMTHALIRNLSKNLHPRLGTLVQAIGHDLHKSYVNLHSNSRTHRNELRKYNAQMRKLGRPSVHHKAIEMVNFQDPQVSSHRPLNMDTTRWNP